MKRAPIAVDIEAGEVILHGDLTIPAGACGIVMFAHGSGSSRFSPRNRFVADRLGARGLATLLLDLLTTDEEEIDNITRELRFDIPLLASRLGDASEWLSHQPQTRALRIGYFGSSTGAAAALIAAAAQPELVGAVVSRGGRVDLAASVLGRVHAPTLLIVGARDSGVLELNRAALALLGAEAKLELVPAATHLFEEPGTLEHVADSAADWFVTHLAERGEVAHPPG